MGCVFFLIAEMRLMLAINNQWILTTNKGSPSCWMCLIWLMWFYCNANNRNIKINTSILETFIHYVAWIHWIKYNKYVVNQKSLKIPKIRSRISRDRKHNDQKTIGQTIMDRTLHCKLKRRNPTKAGGELE
jgi:hypothetical protein